MADFCTACGKDLKLVGRVHRCVPQALRDPPPFAQIVTYQRDPLNDPEREDVVELAAPFQVQLTPTLMTQVEAARKKLGLRSRVATIRHLLTAALGRQP